MADLNIEHLTRRDQFFLTMFYTHIAATDGEAFAAKTVNYIAQKADELEPIEPTTPQPSADAVRELVQRWRERAKRKRVMGLANEALLDEAHADELESLLGRGG